MQATPRDRTLLEARFDPRLKTYYMLQVQFGLLVSFIGIPLMLVWALVGSAIHRRQYEALECELTERSLNLRKGFLFRVQKNVPLDKITDLSLKEGPILRYLGLCSLTVETAGGGAGTGTGQAMLVGVMDAIAFRDAVLEQRDLVSLGGVSGSGAGAAGPAAAAAGSGPGDPALLEELRDSVLRIERLLAERDRA